MFSYVVFLRVNRLYFQSFFSACQYFLAWSWEPVEKVRDILGLLSRHSKEELFTLLINVEPVCWRIAHVINQELVR